MAGDKTSEVRMNLAAIKRVDPYAKDIVDTSAHVAFYTFNSEESEWEKTDVEGAFFIYSRNAEPFHSIFINNRLNTNSFVEPITGQLELQSQPPFLLYRNERSRIRGFWFYNSSECERIGQLVNSLVHDCEIKLTINKKAGNSSDMMKSNTTNNNNIDIFSMLSKAQEDFNNAQKVENSRISSQQQKQQQQQQLQQQQQQHHSQQLTSGSLINTIGGGSGGGGGSGTGGIQQQLQQQQQPDVTSQSVMNFFAAAKPAAASEVPLFQRLLSNPVSVDQIEKQQRATTPLDSRMSPPPLLIGSHSSNNISGIESGINLLRLNSPKQPPNHHQQQQQLQQNSQQDIGTSSLAKFLSSSNLGLPGHGTKPVANVSGPPPPLIDATTIDNSQKSLQQLLKKDVTSLSGPSGNVNSNVVGGGGQSGKPALMPPTMFLSSSSSKLNRDTIQQQQQQQHQSLNCLTRQQSEPCNVHASAASSSSSSTVAAATTTTTGAALTKPEPLTQTQLLQAMLYLIQNDPEFIKKLHEAYLKSFTDMVSL